VKQETIARTKPEKRKKRCERSRQIEEGNTKKKEASRKRGALNPLLKQGAHRGLGGTKCPSENGRKFTRWGGVGKESEQIS